MVVSRREGAAVWSLLRGDKLALLVITGLADVWAMTENPDWFRTEEDRVPTMGFNLRTGVALAFGYSGRGVATANLSGRVLADLLTETDSDLTCLPMTSHQPVPWEPEPLRSLAVNLVRRSHYEEIEQVERTGKYSKKPSLVTRVFNR